MSASSPLRPALPSAFFAELAEATAGLRPPYAVVHLPSLRANARDLVRRAAGKPIRVASKSVRSRALLRQVSAGPGWAGVLAFTLPEALWLAEEFEDVVVGYPTVDTAAVARLASDEVMASRVTLMVDSPAHLDLIDAVLDGLGPGARPVRVCLEVDVSLRLAGGRVHIGARRSPVHTARAARDLAQAVAARPRLRLVGVMAYEGHIAGVGDNRPGPGRFLVRGVRRMSAGEIAERRAAAVASVASVAPLEFVNGGGTGSLETTSLEPAVTEVAAGSGLLAPTLFDFYTRFAPHPASFFALSVVRRPSPRHATLLGGGWVASGAAGADRLPTPAWPAGLRLLPREGAGEVQTPVRGPGAAGLRVGDRVWLRHSKAGELCEHVAELHLVEDGRIVDSVPTYRGEHRTFL
ncbi:amino acid deaminase/aldolase [Streptomyces sp. NRRL F-5065]|uniref:amino acid deaminase/aldolase n=1 Tax=Streptomyces sp. NRRL F-5065 TaxID=1463855 RepID=UPI00099DF994|nr:amino acid deaminase/aldolase [Streptomyces sp. NRRL F-5065]